MGDDFENVIQQFITQASVAIEAVARRIPTGFPQSVSDNVFEGIRAQVQRLEQQGQLDGPTKSQG